MERLTTIMSFHRSGTGFRTDEWNWRGQCRTPLHMPARPMWHHSSCHTPTCSPSDQHHTQVTTQHKRARVPTCAQPISITALLLCPPCLPAPSTSTDALRVFQWHLVIRLLCSRTSRTLTSTSAHSEQCRFEPHGLLRNWSHIFYFLMKHPLSIL